METIQKTSQEKLGNIKLATKRLTLFKTYWDYIDIVNNNPGIIEHEIIVAMRVEQTALNRILNLLVSYGLLEKTKAGRNAHYEVTADLLHIAEKIKGFNKEDGLF